MNCDCAQLNLITGHGITRVVLVAADLRARESRRAGGVNFPNARPTRAQLR